MSRRPTELHNFDEAISLYLDLNQGQAADLEIVAKASLAFTAAIREIAHIVDPSIDIRLTLLTGTDGSLSLNSVIKGIKKYNKPSRAVMKGLAIAALCWFTNDIRQYGVSKILDMYFSSDEGESLTDLEKQQIEKIVAEALKNTGVNAHVSEVFRELERDQAVRGVGASRTHGERPESIVPRSEFQKRAGIHGIVEETSTTRIRTADETVHLVSPVLLQSRRRWKFSFHEGEFGASIKDRRFLVKLLRGQISIPMIAGIEMDVKLETKEEKVGKVWVINSRNILRVYRVRQLPLQKELPLDEEHDEADD